MKRGEQEGYALLVVLLAFSLFVLALARAVPSWKTQIQREREARSIDHAREYRTAIRRYFHKYGRYPPSLDVLSQKDGQGLRYLRQPWPDPLNTKGDNADGSWQVLHYGQAVNAEIVDQPPQAAQASANGGIAGPNLGQTPAGAPAAGQAGVGTGQAGYGQIAGSAMGATGLGSVGGATAAAGLGSGPTTGTGANVGGGPVIGVASFNKETAVHAFNGFDIPNDWQFVYNFAMDPSLRAPAAAGAAQTGTGTTPNATGNPAGSGLLMGGRGGGN